MGQMGVLRAREQLTPERVAQLTPQEREGFRTLEQARRYAESLGLGSSTSYRHVIERDEQDAIRVVVAAAPDHLEPVTWWFPIVGRVAYRGYFDPDAARAFGERLAREGFDTYIRPALLYSTLGFFDDPVPRAVLRWDSTDILITIVHELVHESIFIEDDSAYNEGLATFIAQQAALDYFAEDPTRLAAARNGFADQRRFSELLAALRRELELLYSETSGLEDARRSRAPIFRFYQQEVFPSLPWRTTRYDGFMQAELSNAYLLANQTYLEDVPCFQLELEQLRGDLRAFVQEHRREPGRHGTHEDCVAASRKGKARWTDERTSS